MAEPAVGDIVKNITDDVKILVRGEVALAKQELVTSAKRGGIGVGMFVGAAYFAINAITLLYFAAAFGLWAATGMHLGLAFLIVAGALLVITAVLALVGMVLIKKVRGPKAAVAEANKTIEDVKAAAERGLVAVHRSPSERAAVNAGPSAH